MSEFLKFCQSVSDAAKECAQNPAGAPKETIPCKYCLAEVALYSPEGTVHCRNCGSSFPVERGKSYVLDAVCREKISGKQVYDAAFSGGRVNFSLLELSAQKKYLKALLYLGRHWENKGDLTKADSYYQTASEDGHEGKAAYLLYTLRHAEFERYPKLLDELNSCVENYERHPFYIVDPNACDEAIAYREKLYQAHLEEQRYQALEEAPYTPAFSDEPYEATPSVPEGTDWNGLPWVIAGIGYGV